jgi:hypothetical protein
MRHTPCTTHRRGQVLHLLLHQLAGLGPAPSEALLAFLRVDELLVDIGDDLTDYEDDVADNSFNVYRGERGDIWRAGRWC